jgi:hypothetical protein
MQLTKELKDELARRKPRKQFVRRGRDRSVDTVRVATRGEHYNQAVFTVSEDVVLRLLGMRDHTTYEKITRTLAFQLRMQFRPLDDLNLSSILMRIEPPSFTPIAPLLHRQPGRRIFYASMPCRAVALKHGVMPKQVDLMWAPDLGGVLLMLEEDDMVLDADRPTGDAAEALQHLHYSNLGALKWA